MDFTRRETLALLVAPALLRAADRVKLPSTIRAYEDLTAKKNGENISRPVFDGLNRTGVQIELHETALAPGLMSHPAHRHQHIEIVLLREGTLEVTIDGLARMIGSGGIAYFASNSLHGAKNIGAKHAQYFVLSLEKDQPATSKAAPDPGRQLLPSATYKFEDLKVKESANGNLSRDVLDGLTHTGLQVDIHQTELGPGNAPHAPHRHIHEEIVMLREGGVAATIENKSGTVTPGSVIYAASQDFHGWKNAGTAAKASYFVLALGREPRA